MVKNRTVHRLHSLYENVIYNAKLLSEKLYENDIYKAKLHGGGMSNSLNVLFVRNPFNYIPRKNGFLFSVNI